MAYVEFSVDRLSEPRAFGLHCLAVEDDPFSPLERCVIAFATRDPAATLFLQTRKMRAFRALFGIALPRSLANRKLEALRRVVVSLTHCPVEQSLAEMQGAMAAGVTRQAAG